jgi:hypothetical protein
MMRGTSHKYHDTTVTSALRVAFVDSDIYIDCYSYIIILADSPSNDNPAQRTFSTIRGKPMKQPLPKIPNLVITRMQCWRIGAKNSAAARASRKPERIP